MQRELHDLRKTYDKDALIESEISENPYELFDAWFADAKEHIDIDEVNAMGLTTLGTDGYPKCRTVLLKEIVNGNFVFYTNYLSEKGRSIAEHPKGSIYFFWPALERQILIKGDIIKVSREQSLRYFKSRPRGSQIGAWASNQSQVVSGRKELDQALLDYEKKFEGQEVPLPDHWGGYAVTPVCIEFWQGRPNRMHDRIVYELDNDNWTFNRVAP